MAILKGPGVISDGLNANTESLDFAALLPVPSAAVVTGAGGGQLTLGQVVCRDVTKQSSNLLPANLLGSSLFVPAGDQVCLPSSANAGDPYGVYQGSGTTFTNTSGASQNVNQEQFRKVGVGWVLASAPVGGTSVKVGDALAITVAAPFINGAVSATRAIGSSVGRVIATPIRGNIALATASGAQTVVVSNPAGFPFSNGYQLMGITTTVPITVDAGTANQEIVTPSAIVAGTSASTTLTVAGTPGINTLTTTFAGTGMPAYVVSVSVTGTDTATTAAVKMVLAINALQGQAVATNAAGVITISGAAPGTANNAITATPSVTGAGGFTYTGTAALSGGINSTFTATFVNAHAANTPFVGLASAVGAVLLPAGTGGAFQGLVLADINVLG